jgi:hypothetical protein
MWIATPSPKGTCTLYFLPVSPAHSENLHRNLHIEGHRTLDAQMAAMTSGFAVPALFDQR